MSLFQLSLEFNINNLCGKIISTPESFINQDFMDTQEKVNVCQLPKRLRGNYARQKFQKVQIITNFYRVDVLPISQIHIFRFKITPPIPLDDRTTRSQIIQATIGKIKSCISDPVFSGFNIYSTRAPIEKQFTASTPTHELSVKEVKVLSIKQNPQILVTFLNNGLRNLMSKLKYIELGRSGKYFNTQNKQKIQNLFMFSGYKANFMQLEKGIYLRVDTAKKIVRNQTVLQYIDQFYRQNGDKGKQQKRQLLKQQLLNKIIMTNYGKPRYLKIIDIQFKDIDTVTVSDQNCTIRQYYTKKYNIQIQNPKQPLLVVEGSKRKENDKVLLIPQICLMTGIPDDFDQYKRKKISEVTIKSADSRKSQISKLMEQIKNTSEINSLKEIGIKVGTEMERFQAKIIPPPRIKLGRDQKIQSGKESFFNLFAQPIYASKHGLKVAVVYFKTSDVRQLLDICEQTSQKLGIEFRVQKICAGEYDSRRAISLIDESLQKAIDKYDCNIGLIVIPVQLKSQYKVIKEKCLLKNKLICQIVTEATLKKNGFRSVATKILLQLIAKRGNTLWVPESALKLQKVMLAAFDTGKFGGKNIMSGVATINSTYSSISSKIEEYNDINDKMNCMMGLLLKLIDSYVKRNKDVPKQVLLFSNSCSNDQISLYHEFMISPLISKLEQIYKQQRPAVTIVLINTKTNERFFQSQGNGVKNVPAGTIVSENIVSNNYDFFMISQFATRGSTVPNHYKVIHTDSKMEEGVLQELIYSQCFNYVNWTGSIKVPGILQYAKKCVKFNTQVLQNKRICQELQSKLYFI